jgi:hypothetical protein
MMQLVVTAKVTDASGRVAEASVTVDVLEPQPVGTGAEGSRM